MARIDKIWDVTSVDPHPSVAVIVNIGVDGDAQAPLTASSVASVVHAALKGCEVEIAVRFSRTLRGRGLS